MQEIGIFGSLLLSKRTFTATQMAEAMHGKAKSSYAGVLLGLSSLPTRVAHHYRDFSGKTYRGLPRALLPVSSTTHSLVNASPLRYSRRLAAKAELSGG